MSLSVVDWLFLSQAFKDGHFKKIKISFPHWFGAGDTTPLSDGFSLRLRPYCSFSGCDRGEAGSF